MTMRSSPPKLSGTPADRLCTDSTAPHSGGLFVSAVAFFCFMPYPAIPVGNSSAIQIGNVLIIVAALTMSAAMWRRVPVSMVLLLMAPLALSMLKVLLIDDVDASLCVKATAAGLLSVMTVAILQPYAQSYPLEMLSGIALATLVHFAVGMWQMYCFNNGVFPFAGLYVNPSFLSVQANATLIARWTQRPFGIFPEPSAMSSSLAPFVLFFAAVCLGIVRLRKTPSPRQLYLFASASAGGLALIIVSRSGHAAPTLAALLLIVGLWLLRARGNVNTFLLITAMLGLLVPAAVYFAYGAMSRRLNGGTDMGNSSWEERSFSLMLGLRLWSEQGLCAALFGLGPGITGLQVRESTGISAVFSILLTYLYDTGVCGLIALCVLGQRLFGVWSRSRYSILFAAIGLVWLVGVTLTTSYGQLLPIWIALAWFGAWNEICEPRRIRVSTARPARLAQLPPLQDRMSPWTTPAPDRDCSTSRVKGMAL